LGGHRGRHASNCRRTLGRPASSARIASPLDIDPSSIPKNTDRLYVRYFSTVTHACRKHTTYGGIAACDNVVRINRERAESAITDYLATDLLSPAAIEAAQQAYADEIARQRRQSTNASEINCSGELAAIEAQETQLRGLLKAGTLSADVATAALDALDNKRRKLSKPVKRDDGDALREFSLKIERYRSAVENLGKLLSNSDRVVEARSLVQEILGGQGTVLREAGRVGAQFPLAGLLRLAGIETAVNSTAYNRGSGGKQRTWTEA
jgi:hypothetical protein